MTIFHGLDTDLGAPRCHWCFGDLRLVTAKREERDQRAYRREYWRCAPCAFTVTWLGRYWPGEERPPW